MVQAVLVLQKDENDIPLACVRRSKAQRMGNATCAAMKDKLGRQQFDVIIQAAANGKIVARETLKVCGLHCLVS
jgi:translation elongation factor EF-4